MKKNKKMVGSKGYDLLQNDSYELNNTFSEKEELDFNMDPIVDDSHEEDTEELINEIDEESNSEDEEQLDEIEEDYIEEQDESGDDDESPVPDVNIKNTLNSDVLDSTDINSIFEQANNNVLSAKNIFNQNIEMKKKLDAKFLELKQLKAQHEARKNEDYKKIKKYKDEVYEKLQQKKEEVEAQIEKLKDAQNAINEEKTKFENYKNHEIEKLRTIKKEQKAAIEDKRNELEVMENEFKIKTDLFEEEKRQLELDRIKYAADKNELANNLLKFNELVSDFSINIDKFNDKK